MNGIHRLMGLYPKWTLWLDLAVIAVTAASNGWVCMKARRYFQCD